ncbi:hypothetical protein D0T12_27165 [Actinomadura spongiicola]|uniref:Chorismate-utilising enzyme C-terminal domain-containing protein n=1 Tax=Actinomadura spongiicola TaxID=2303421 RepID=A0A372GAV0_9ACTN|nr:hypothetical protein D0T12_27165 [Actinomadura spongiicola]
MVIAPHADAKPAEPVVETASDLLSLMSRLGRLADVHRVRGLRTTRPLDVRGRLRREVVLDASHVHTRWRGETPPPTPGRAARSTPSARPSTTPRFPPGPIGGTRSSSPRPGPAAAGSRTLLVPRTEVRVEDGRARITGDAAEAEQVAALLTEAVPLTVDAPSPVDIRAGGNRYRAQVAEAVAEIRAGRYQKVIVSRRLDAVRPVDIVATYIRGHHANTPARSFLLDLDGFQATGFNPEVLAAVDSTGGVPPSPSRAPAPSGSAPPPTSAPGRTWRPTLRRFTSSPCPSAPPRRRYQVCDPSTVQVTGFMTVKGTRQRPAPQLQGRRPPRPRPHVLGRLRRPVPRRHRVRHPETGGDRGDHPPRRRFGVVLGVGDGGFGWGALIGDGDGDLSVPADDLDGEHAAGLPRLGVAERVDHELVDREEHVVQLRTVGEERRAEAAGGACLVEFAGKGTPPAQRAHRDGRGGNQAGHGFPQQCASGSSSSVFIVTARTGEHPRIP